MGERAVASCVIFDRLAMQTNTALNVTPPEGAMITAMREALTRRCARIVTGELPTPDLFVVDGGKGSRGRRRRAREQGCTTPAHRDREGRRASLARRISSRIATTLNFRRIIRSTRCSRFATRRTGSRSRVIARAELRTTSSLEEIAGIGAEAARAARALRRPQGRAGGEHRRSCTGARGEPRARRKDFRGIALKRLGALHHRADGRAFTITSY